MSAKPWFYQANRRGLASAGRTMALAIAGPGGYPQYPDPLFPESRAQLPMDSFIFVVGSPQPTASQHRLRTALQLSAQLRPQVCERDFSETWIPELQCGWCTETPRVTGTAPLIAEANGPELAVLVFGQVDSQQPALSALRDAYAQGGAAAVEQLGGCFFAIIVDKVQRQIHFCSDLIGQRGASYLQHNSEVWVASQSLALIATGLEPVTLDPVSVASVVAGDWSFGPHTLAQGISSHDPNLRRSWSPERGLTALPAPRLNLQSRLAATDARGIRAQLDKVITSLRDRTRRFAAGQVALHSELTAGLDSRAVLALLASVPHSVDWVTHTSGAVDSLDVRVARRLARLVHAEHRGNEATALTGTDFEAHATLRSIATNGEFNCKQALGPLPQYASSGRVVAKGTGGEIFRGFFYGYFGALGNVPRDVQAISSALCKYRFRRLGKLPFTDELYRSAVRERLTKSLEQFQTESPHGADIVDLFYLFERYRRWGSASARCTWSRAWTPFESSSAIAQAFELPAPVGARCIVHTLAIERFLPLGASLIPINGGSLVWLDHLGGAPAFALQQALKVQAKLLDAVSRKRNAKKRSADDTRADAFRQQPHLRELLADLLGSSDSALALVFGQAGSAKLLQEHQRGADHLQTLGFGLGVELWRRAAQRAFEQAQTANR